MSYITRSRPYDRRGLHNEGPLILHDFDVLEHLITAKANPNYAGTAAVDDLPITVPERGRRSSSSPTIPERGRRSSRSRSPTRRSPRLNTSESGPSTMPVSSARSPLRPHTRAAHRLENQQRLGTVLKEVVRKRFARALPVHVTTTPSDFAVASTGWVGVRDNGDSRQFSLEELQNNLGFSVISWDGLDSRPLVDKEKRIIGVLGGRPRDDTYLNLTKQAGAEIEQAREDLRWLQDLFANRRGVFSSASVGISYGGGQIAPGNLKVRPEIVALFEKLFSLSCFDRMSGFGNTLYRTWNPRVHADFEDMLDDCIEDNPALKRNFPAPRSAFAAATINIGPATVTNRHVDAHNLAWGWCCITALGDFDADRGGHLILWDLKLVIRFPAGSTILIPSAILRHSNVPIVAGQRRYSFTQYSAAGLFRWVDNGFRSDRSIKEDPVMQADKAYLASRTAARRTRWQTGINKYLRWNGA